MGTLFTLALALAYAMGSRTLFSPLQQLVAADLQLGDLELSLVQGLAASVPVALLSMPVGRWVDRANRIRLLMALLGVSVLGTVLTALVQSFWPLFLARMLAGAGASCALPVAISVVADLAPPERRGRALLGLSLGNMTGAALAFGLAGALLRWHGSGVGAWRSIHLDFAVVGTLVLGMLALLREPPRQEVAMQTALPLRVALEALWARRALLLPLFVGQVTVVMADTAAGIWMAPVITRRFGQTPEQFAAWSGLVILVGGLVGSALGALSADFGQSRRLPGGLLGGAVVAAGLSVPAAFYPLAPDAGTFAVTLGIFLTCGAVTGLVTATAIAVRLPNELRGVCLGAFVVVGALIGFGLAPTLVTWVSTALGGSARLPLALAIVSVVTSAMAFAGFLAAARETRPV